MDCDIEQTATRRMAIARSRNQFYICLWTKLAHVATKQMTDACEETEFDMGSVKGRDRDARIVFDDYCEGACWLHMEGTMTQLIGIIRDIRPTFGHKVKE